MSSDNRKTRPILPRAIANDNPGPATTESSPTSAAARGATYPNTRTNIRSACLACRRRRSRCSGGNPCNRCRALETECTYNETSDGRTRALRDRSREELELHKRVINGVFRAVREGREHGILEMIRNESSLELIAAAIDDSNIETRSESASETTEIPSATQEQTDEGSSSHSGTYQRHNVHFEAQHFGRPDTFLTGQQTWRTGQPSSSGTSMREVLSHQHTLGTSEMRFMQQPLHQRDESDLSRLSALYLQFRGAAREMIHQGVSPAQILGSSTVSCGMLFVSQSAPFGVATWASAIVNSIPGVDILFRLAWLCYITRFMRWAVDETKESFELMPEAMIPTGLQVSVPHAPVIDLIPIPQIRDQMIMNFRDFSAAVEIAGATVHWTESIDDAIDRDPATGGMTVSSRFENHISNIDNLCFGRSLLNVFPELEGQLQLAEVDQIVSVSTDASPAGWTMDSDPGI